MSTTATDRKARLICEILAIIFPKKKVNNIGFVNGQTLTFTMPVMEYSRATSPTSHEVSYIETRFELRWDNELNFELWTLKKGARVVQQHIPSSTWFKVRDLIRQRFLDAEKLKTA